MRGEIYSGPDRYGNYHYALFWMANYHPGDPAGEHRLAERGQHFFGDPSVHDIVKWADLRKGAIADNEKI